MSAEHSDDKNGGENCSMEKRSDNTALIPVTRNSRSMVERTHPSRPLISLTPMERQLAIGAGRVGLTIADGLLLSSTVANPVLTIAFIAYESFRSVSDYRRGELNRLGYRTTLTDVALRISKEVGTAAVGVGIGSAVGTLVGISAIPVAGQFVLTTVLSVALGICVGTLITRYADRMFVRLQLQSQYGYLPNEKKARRRFEQLLELQHDLSSFETCRIVQHYRDYRIANGWERATDVDDYRSTADIFMMPVSFQHFAIVQLQRKWGFLNERSECKKVFKALMLVHHPDKGGSSQMAAQLNHDFEVYAFCQDWAEDCPSIYNTGNANGVPSSSPTTTSARPRRHVVDFLRSLFRQASNSAVEAEDLRQYGILALEAGTPVELHRLDELETQDNIEEAHVGIPVFGTSASAKQRSVSRVLGSIQNCYQLATEAITFAGLENLYREPGKWSQLKLDVLLFNRMQTFACVVDEISYNDVSVLFEEHYCCGFKWCSKEEAIAKREELRESIISLCFPLSVSSKLMEALELWKTAKSLVENFLKQCAGVEASGVKSDEGTGQTLDTLLSIQKALQNLASKNTETWMKPETSIEECLETPFVREINALGLTASCALAGAHAISVHKKLRGTCEEYFKSRRRKKEAVASLLNEVHDVRSNLKCAIENGNNDEIASLQARNDDYIRQLVSVHQIFGEVDAVVGELCDAYTLHLPEHISILRDLPSSCVQSICDGLELPRYIKYERERSLMNYMNVELEPENAIDPTRTPAESNVTKRDFSSVLDDESTVVEFALLRAQFVDPLNGTVTPCWLKRYTFTKVEPQMESEEREEEVRRNRALLLFKRIVEQEFRVTESCDSHRLTSATDVFCDDYARQMFFHLPRGGTQVRFGSTHDVNKRIAPLGLRWLYDALQSIIELHSCQLVHGSISLSNFTFDDFGNTTLGFFSSALRSRMQEASTPAADAVDFGASLHAEVLPYLHGYSSIGTSVYRPPMSTRTKKTDSQTLEQQQEEVFLIFKEVADRLIGKQEPRWTLLDARTFVRRYLEFSYDSDERNYLFTKRVSYPAYWVTQKSIIPVSLVVDRRVLMELPRHATAFLNRNIYLWEKYWKCRRKMVQKRGGGLFSIPVGLRNEKPFLPCSDDCEVNERFLWYECKSEEEAWQVCLEGIFAAQQQLRFTPPWVCKKSSSEVYYKKIPVWSVVLRVSLGTVVVKGEDAVTHVSSPDKMKQTCGISSLVNELEQAAQQRCMLIEKNKDELDDILEVIVPAPGFRCYPEYMICCPPV